MSQKSSTLRLDEILLAEGLVTEGQIKEALDYQRQHGGKIGSHLMRNNYIDEASLVAALSKHFDCDGVVLSEMVLTEEVLSMLPYELAIARRAIPFAFDDKTKTLKLACDDPNNEKLSAELQYATGASKVKLYVAAELALKSAIAGHYVVTGPFAGKRLDDSSPTSPAVEEETGEPEEFDLDFLSDNRPLEKVLLVTDDHESGEKMLSLLKSQACEAEKLDSADDAIDRIQKEAFDTVLIKDSVPGDYIDLIDRLRKISPGTNVQYFESASSLLLGKNDYRRETDLMVQNLELFTSLLDTNFGHHDRHASIVGQYVNRLCEYLGLRAKERQLITTAAYLHDISKYYYGPHEMPDSPRGQIDLTIKHLSSLDHDPVVIEILRSMYINLRGKYTQRLPIEVLGGNIITIVDIFCENVGADGKITFERYEAMRKKFEELTGKLFLVEVSRGFLDLVNSEVLHAPEEVKYGQVMIFGEETAEVERIERSLRSEGFHTIGRNTYTEFIELFSRSRPDMLVLVASGEPIRMMSLVEDLMMRGIDVASLPTFVLADTRMAASLTDMFDRGIEDIIIQDEKLELLAIKLRKAHTQIESQLSPSDLPPAAMTGTRGNLSDMNLIDLLQAMGPSRKTARLTIISS
ncbi:MAG: hypothetical protein V3T31_02935, partial [candidate division Zixibacteria bacterium]